MQITKSSYITLSVFVVLKFSLKILRYWIKTPLFIFLFNLLNNNVWIKRNFLKAYVPCAMKVEELLLSELGRKVTLWLQLVLNLKVNNKFPRCSNKSKNFVLKSNQAVNTKFKEFNCMEILQINQTFINNISKFAWGFLFFQMNGQKYAIFNFKTKGITIYMKFIDSILNYGQ